MKIFASTLMVVIALHCVCMGRCLGQQNSVKPPCHHQGEAPKPDSDLCFEGPALEAKTSPALRCTLDFVGVPCVIPDPASPLTHLWQRDSDFVFETASPPLLPLTVLRI